MTESPGDSVGEIEFDREASPLFKQAVLDAIDAIGQATVERVGETNRYRLRRLVDERAVHPGVDSRSESTEEIDDLR